MLPGKKCNIFFENLPIKTENPRTFKVSVREKLKNYFYKAKQVQIRKQFLCCMFSKEYLFRFLLFVSSANVVFRWIVSKLNRSNLSNS